MIPLQKLLGISEYALYNKFDVELHPDEETDGIDIKIYYGQRTISYRALDDGIFIEDIEFNGAYRFFDAEMNLLSVMQKIGNMLLDAVDKKKEE